jgi:hypothetical protein
MEMSRLVKQYNFYNIVSFNISKSLLDMLSSPVKARKLDTEIDTGILSDKTGWGQSSSIDTKGNPVC